MNKMYSVDTMHRHASVDIQYDLIPAVETAHNISSDFCLFVSRPDAIKYYTSFDDYSQLGIFSTSWSCCRMFAVQIRSVSIRVLPPPMRLFYPVFICH